jgi:hypothetical protein
MSLEQIYVNRYVNPLIAINHATANDLLGSFEEAVIISPNIKKILAAINSDSSIVNENALTDEQKIFFIAGTKLVNSYKESTSAEFNARFESLINEELISSNTSGSSWASKLGSFFGSVGRGLKDFTKGVLKGFEGSEGKNKDGKANLNWKDVLVFHENFFEIIKQTT